MRSEKDFLGEKKIPVDALYGIHSIRAKENFPDGSSFSFEWYKALATVKKACYLTARDFFQKAEEQYELNRLPIKTIPNQITDALVQSTEECEQGKHFEQFIVPGISGGAGTSINMNVNEIIANLALTKLGHKAGEYKIIDPIEHANIFQSTNDALSRDWWRTSKCLERIKVVNLGGSAIGTSVAVPKFFVSEVVAMLQSITGLPITRGENLSDVTANLDPFVEVHGILKAHAVNLEKISGDIRLLASDLHGGDVEIPKKQAGSSIMPGKINPVIAEFVISSSARIYANDALITSLSAQGCLELKAYIPTIGMAIIESLELLIACNITLKDNLFSELKVHAKASEYRVMNSPAITTVLLPFIGYNKASELAKYMKEHKVDIYKANAKLRFMEEAKLKKALKPEYIVQGGYLLKDLL